MDEGQGRFEVPYKPQGQGIEILRKDFKGSTFKITCNEHKSYSGSTVMLGSVVHEVNFDVVLESFEMKSCSLDHINANRRIVNKENHFKTVFKMADGTCEEREYKLGDERTSKNKYYNGLTIHRSSPKRVTCPSSFVGDMGENAFLPWLRIRFLRTIVLRWFKPEPYEVEV